MSRIRTSIKNKKSSLTF